jgi:NADH-quinone oxidoreductase subunit J
VEEVVFFVAALGAIGGALAVILARNPFYSVLSLVVHLFALATLFLLLHAEFIAAAQIVVYAGAIMVLYVFVVAYIGGVEEAGRTELGGIGSMGAVFAAALFTVVTIAVVGTGLTALDSEGAEVGAGFGTPGAVGDLLLRKFLITFEAASILLLIAAVGAVVLARKRRGLPEPVGGEAESLGRPAQAPESVILGGAEAEPTRPPAGTAEGPGEPVPSRPPSTE